jgi:glycosyltransferase involved in cell wall biosynthesis
VEHLAERDGSRPKVSVVTITYNQEKFARTALDGIVAQVTDFDVEVIVADDCSRDGTPRVVTEYAERHPDLIRPVLREKNLGMTLNFIDVLQTVRGDYIAMCEGDDFWNDPNKLQRQVDLLETNPRLALCFHPVHLLDEEASDDSHFFPDPDDTEGWTVERLLVHNFIQTNSVMYRRLPSYASVPANAMPLDWYMHLLHAREGGIGFLAEPMATYRRHGASEWWSTSSNRLGRTRRYGLDQLGFEDALLKLFESTDYDLTASRARAVAQLDALREADRQDGTDLFAQGLARYPRVVAAALDALQRDLKQADENVMILNHGVETARSENRRVQRRLENAQERIATLQAKVAELDRKDGEGLANRARDAVRRLRTPRGPN